MSVGSSGTNTLCASAKEELGTLADNNPLTGYEPKFFDDYHFSETTEWSYRVQLGEINRAHQIDEINNFFMNGC